MAGRHRPPGPVPAHRRLLSHLQGRRRFTEIAVADGLLLALSFTVALVSGAAPQAMAPAIAAPLPTITTAPGPGPLALPSIGPGPADLPAWEPADGPLLLAGETLPAGDPSAEPTAEPSDPTTEPTSTDPPAEPTEDPDPLPTACLPVTP